MQNILTNRHKDIPILLRRNLNRQIVDKQANQKEEGVGMGTDKPQRRPESPSRAWDPSVRRDVPTWSSRWEHLKSRDCAAPRRSLCPSHRQHEDGVPRTHPQPQLALRPSAPAGAACTQAASLHLLGGSLTKPRPRCRTTACSPQVSS